MASKASQTQNTARKRRRRKRGVPTSLAIFLLIIALLMGGMLGFVVARNTDRSRIALQAAKERINELENILTLIGFDVEEGDTEEWIYSDEPGSTPLDELSDGFNEDISDLWNDDGALTGMLSEEGQSVVVAEYDGGFLMSDEVIPIYNDELTAQIFAGYNADEISNSLLIAVMSNMISDRLMAAKAQELGLDELTADDLKAIEAEAAQEYADMLEYYSIFVTEPGMSDEEIRAAATEYMEQQGGVTLESIAADKRDSWWLQKMFAELVKGIDVTDDEIRTHYDEVLAEQKSDYSQSPEDFEYAHINGETQLYHPQGYRAVRDILIPFRNDDDIITAADLFDQLENLDPEKDAEALQACTEQLNALYAPLEALAQEALDKLSAGASFADLMDEYGCDEFLAHEPLRSEGYYLSSGSFLNSAEYVEGAMILDQPGQHSTPLRSPYGLHIVEYIGDVQAGEVPLEQVKDAMREEALELKQLEQYEQQRTAMLEAANVKYYPERLQ